MKKENSLKKAIREEIIEEHGRFYYLTTKILVCWTRISAHMKKIAYLHDTNFKKKCQMCGRKYPDDLLSLTDSGLVCNIC